MISPIIRALEGSSNLNTISQYDWVYSTTFHGKSKTKANSFLTIIEAALFLIQLITAMVLNSSDSLCIADHFIISDVCFLHGLHKPLFLTIYLKTYSNKYSRL